ncbi:hypothetical protein [Aureibacter tunicatorum]|uniref:Uncharacterized protein n=1 Tax=Aureibacter tunicatorum TaxID=866807 RepID=A0AAE4BS93_9BACT|nr:hypothetical protein [Aureibacter tunicatorum]MDR6240984.1 hypothetical protein [Aureibacter tunicatorum]
MADEEMKKRWIEKQKQKESQNTVQAKKSNNSNSINLNTFTNEMPAQLQTKGNGERNNGNSSNFESFEKTPPPPESSVYTEHMQEFWRQQYEGKGSEEDWATLRELESMPFNMELINQHAKYSDKEIIERYGISSRLHDDYIKARLGILADDYILNNQKVESVKTYLRFKLVDYLNSFLKANKQPTYEEAYDFMSKFGPGPMEAIGIAKINHHVIIDEILFSFQSRGKLKTLYPKSLNEIISHPVNIAHDAVSNKGVINKAYTNAKNRLKSDIEVDTVMTNRHHTILNPDLSERYFTEYEVKNNEIVVKTLYREGFFNRFGDYHETLPE